MEGTLTPAEAAVLDAVDPAELVEDLRAAVAVPSVGGTDAEVEVQAWAAHRLRSAGAEVDHWQLDLASLRADDGYPGEEVRRDEAWGCVGTVQGRDGGTPALVIGGHLDVVPPGEAQLWPGGDPWTLREADGELRGRGACDMKAGVVAAIGAVAALRRAGVCLARPLAVHTVVAEEDGGLGTFATLRRGHVGDACVIAEPTHGDLLVANSGACTFTLEVHGLATHGATRTRGVSALDCLLPVLAALRELEAQRNADVDPRFSHLDLAAPISVGTVHAGDWSSTVPDRLVAEGRFGVLPGEPMELARRVFESTVAAVCAEHPWLSEHPVRVTWSGGQFASGTLPDGSGLDDDVAACVQAVGAAAPRRLGAPYGSDLRLYAAAGVPTLQYGPGDVGLAHAVDERVPADQLVTAARVFALLALRRCGVA
ncbi:MAG: ArgE/DapE family deacylase [Actinomycetes bacterium]